jgi:hypothetical protein
MVNPFQTTGEPCGFGYNSKPTVRPFRAVPKTVVIYTGARGITWLFYPKKATEIWAMSEYIRVTAAYGKALQNKCNQLARENGFAHAPLRGKHTFNVFPLGFKCSWFHQKPPTNLVAHAVHTMSVSNDQNTAGYATSVTAECTLSCPAPYTVRGNDACADGCAYDPTLSADQCVPNNGAPQDLCTTAATPSPTPVNPTPGPTQPSTSVPNDPGSYFHGGNWTLASGTTNGWLLTGGTVNLWSDTHFVCDTTNHPNGIPAGQQETVTGATNAPGATCWYLG